MSEDTGHNVPDSRDISGTTSASSTRARRRRQGRNGKKYRQHDGKNTFKGPLVGYESYVYDISRNTTDAFNTTTRKLSEYIARSVSNAGEFMIAMNPDDLGFDVIVEPPDPDENGTQIEYEKWKTKYKNWDTLTTKREEASKAAFAIIIGQCSDVIKDKMKTYTQWDSIQTDMDIIELLRLIRTTMYSGTAHNKSTLTYIDAEQGLVNYKQTKNVSNSRYLEIFRNRVEVYTLFGGEPGMNTARVRAQLEANGIDPARAGKNQVSKAKNEAKEEYLAVLFIKNSDASRYGKRVSSLKIKYVERNDNDGDPYPSTLAKALEMLETWEDVNKSSPQTLNPFDESGLAYNAEGFEFDYQGGRGG